MALDGIYLHHIKNEIEKEILNARVEQVWASGLYFVMQLYKEKQRYYLTFNLTANYTSVYLSKKPVDKVDNSNFLNSLKKHLTGGILKELTQFSSDRVLIFKFTVYDFILGPIEKELVFEAMGRHSNLILLEDNKIIDLYKRMFVLDGRHMVPNATYEFFKTEKLDASTYEFNPLLTPKEISEKYLGISLRLAKYLAEHPIKPYDIKIEPTLSLKENKSYFFNLFEGETKSFKSLSETLENRIMETKDDKLPYTTFIKNQLKKLEKKRDQLLKQKYDAELHLSDKDKGDLIYASGFDLTSKLSHVEGLELNNQKSLSQNAQGFYKNYQKAKRALSFIDSELQNVYSQLEIFNTFMSELNLASKHELNDFRELFIPYGYLKQSSKSNRQTKHKVEILTIRDQDATYYIGKNSLQNGKIINDLGTAKDFWFHVKDAPGSHVLVKSESLNEPIIRKAASLAAYFSSLRQSSSIPVLYTQFRNVSKMSGKPSSLVKVKNEKTIFIDIDEEQLKSFFKNA